MHALGSIKRYYYLSPQATILIITQSNEAKNFSMHIQLLLSGDEIINGDTIDTNSAWIAQALQPYSLHIQKRMTVGDNLDYLVDAIRAQSAQADVLIINGGLGPTQDDLTAVALGQAINSPLITNTDAEKQVVDWCQRRGFEANQANLKQAIMPAACTPIKNLSGSAPGIYCRYNDCDIYCTPGVPSELKSQFTTEIIPRLTPDTQGALLIRKYQLFGIGESRLQQLISDLKQPLPSTVSVGFRADIPTLELKLITQRATMDDIDIAETIILPLIEDHIVAQGDQTQAKQLITKLSGAGLKMASAESCTGGLIASTICAEPGASSAFEGAYITYSNAMKTALLNVDAELIETQGAVSEAVARAMLMGVFATSAADIGVSVTGIAGPDGGSEDKPTGTVWLAWGDRDIQHSVCLLIPAPRLLFQRIVSCIALDLISRHIHRTNHQPTYLARYTVQNSN